jgi:hypothetical protein
LLRRHVVSGVGAQGAQRERDADLRLQQGPGKERALLQSGSPGVPRPQGGGQRSLRDL